MNKDLWGTIDLELWQQVPHIKNRIATEKDILDGVAVFYVDPKSSESTALDITIPSLAWQKDEETNEEVLAVIIQGEKVDDANVVGIRYFNGGNIICMLEDLRIENK